MTQEFVHVTGVPIPQGSKNSFRHSRTGKVVVVESQHNKLQAWRSKIGYAWKRQAGIKITGPVHVTLDFYMPRPQNHYGTGRNAGKLKDWAPKYCDKKPDGDKLVRAVLDALTIAGAIEDDARVVRYWVNKMYADEPGAEGVSLIVCSMDNTR